MILIVDDKPENIFSLKRTLEIHDFVVDSAGSGEEALRKILRQSYSLILLDVQMPGMDGFEVAEALGGFSKARDIPIIFLSAVNTDKRFIAKGYRSGATDYVTKPIDPDILLLKVKTFYKLSEQRRELNRIQQSLRREIEIRKAAQEALDARVQELRSVLESMPQMAFTIKENGEIEYVNAQWFAFSPDASVFPETHPDDSMLCDEWEIAFGKGEEFVKEVRLRPVNSPDYRYHLLKIIPVRQNDAITKWVGTFTDIHEQKLANEVLEQTVLERTRELVQKNEELEIRNHELQQFAWVASHDLKEPLRKIQIFNTLVKERYPGENREVSHYLDRSIKASERMTHLINDLLVYSRLSVDTMFEKTDLKAIVAEILSDFEVVIAEKDATVIVEDLPVVEAVPTQMRQVFQNLISNSLKFSKPGVTPVIEITARRIAVKAVEAPEHPEGPFVRISVTDNGIGFNEKYLEKIFVLFQRLNDRETYEGTGIGLAIAKKIIEKHNGLLTARSREEEGACFIVVLPVHH